MLPRPAAALALAAWAALAAASAPEKERAEVPQPAAVSFAGVRYQAPPFMCVLGLPRNGGYVEAVDELSGKTRWRVDVVGMVPDDGKEQDKQDVFITDLRLAPGGQHLLVTDERGSRYRIELRTHRVSRLP